MIDGGTWYYLSILDQLSVRDVEYMRFLNFNVATTRYGPGFNGGVIEVMSRGNRQD